MVLRRESKGIESIYKHDQVMVKHLAENKVKERLNLQLGKEKRIRAAIKGEQKNLGVSPYSILKDQIRKFERAQK